MTVSPIDKIEVPTKEIDLDLFIFIERYATNLLKWDLLTLFGYYPDQKKSVQEITQASGYSYRAVRSEIGDLAILGVLEKSGCQDQPLYQLAQDPIIRSQVIKFARHSQNNQ